MTLIATGLPSRSRSVGPGTVPLYAVVLTTLPGASSSEVGAIRMVWSTRGAGVCAWPTRVAVAVSPAARSPSRNRRRLGGVIKLDRWSSREWRGIDRLPVFGMAAVCEWAGAGGPARRSRCACWCQRPASSMPPQAGRRVSRGCLLPSSCTIIWSASRSQGRRCCRRVVKEGSSLATPSGTTVVVPAL
jgi:hypothetical protein